MTPVRTWSIATLCLLLLLGAMGATSWWMLRMEKDQERMAAAAVLGERERLALWRMESTASTLVLEESTRPPEHYRAMGSPDNLWGSEKRIGKGEVLSLSPLLKQRPDHVRLHFQMDATGKLSSPQVPEGMEMKLAGDEIDQATFAACTFSLQELRGILEQPSTTPLVVRDPSTGFPVTCAVSSMDLVLTGNNLTVLSDKALNWQEPEIGGENIAMQQRSVPDLMKDQITLNNAEAGYRQQAFNRASKRSANDDVKAFSKTVEEKSVESSQAAKKPPESKPEKKEIPPAPKPADQVQSDAQIQQAAADQAQYQQALQGAAVSQQYPVPVPLSAQVQENGIGDIRPLWLGEALLLTRRFTEDSRSYVQGAWIDWPRLRSEMLASVLADFPAASLVPEPPGTVADQRRLISLPVRFIPGAVAMLPGPAWTPLKVSLALAWGCVVLAVVAVAMVLRGMLTLSERRASFVSSVTHELRTPLSTFKLYSEMLADGMVADASRRQQYLETLTTEADRLGHLVENVLTYSRLERGKSPGRSDSLTLRELADRLCPRLQQRAAQAGMDFSCHVDAGVSGTDLRTDLRGVEQILFNLADNAAKYGRRSDVPGKMELLVTVERGRAVMRVRDHGPGIDRNEAGRLFRPFHKSARDAAHSAPGVGLGLALCRRLAADLGGRLEIDASWKQGACFALSLPLPR